MVTDTISKEVSKPAGGSIFMGILTAAAGRHHDHLPAGDCRHFHGVLRVGAHHRCGRAAPLRVRLADGGTILSS